MLSTNDALAPYGGGPRGHRSRGYVTVREPAKGFFMTGSSIEDVNGIYAPVHTMTLTQFKSKPQIAYRNDRSGWLMVLTAPRKQPQGYGFRPRQRNPRRYPRPGGLGRRMQIGYSSSSESESEEEDEPAKWYLVDVTGRERFEHEGDTIIPGAGPRWSHVHGTPGVSPMTAAVAAASAKAHAALLAALEFHDCEEDDGYDTAAEEEGELEKRPKKEEPKGEPATSSAIVEPKPDDEDELPWQVIAVLDIEVLQEIRMAYRHYERTIILAKAGSNLPKPGPTSLEGCCKPGTWVYQVVSPGGVTVRTAPSLFSRQCDHRAKGQYVCALERRGDWLRLEGSDPTPYAFRGSGSDEDGLWVQVQDKRGAPLLQLVAEENHANLLVPPDNGPEADIFDRPFEPRLQDDAEESPEGDEEGEGTQEGVLEMRQQEANEEISPDPCLPRLAVGTQVSLEGLKDSRHNGKVATVAAAEDGDGLLAVKLADSGLKLHLSALHLRPILAAEAGELGQAARVLGVRLAALGLGAERGGGGPSAAQAQERLAAALRAAQRDALEAFEAEADARSAYGVLLAAVQDRPDGGGGGTGEEPLPPHAALEAGALGLRASMAARAVSSQDSAAEVEEGIVALRQLLGDERRRQARAAGLQWPLPADQLNKTPLESSDTLLLRLTLVRALLRSRREEDALKEAVTATRQHPGDPAACLWAGRCMLRVAKREEGIQMITAAAEAGSSGAPHALWGADGAAVRLRAIQRADDFRKRAEDCYGRGAFEAGVRFYGEALEASPSDDKWGRATLYAGRAACHRRARALAKAVDDCDAALALFPRYCRAHFRRGACLLEAGRPQEAVKAFQRLLRHDRNWPNLCDWLVRAHAQVKRAEQGGASPGSFGGDFAAEPEAPMPEGGDDFYAVLGVSTDATDKQLKRAYRLMSLKYHPDKQGGSTRSFQLIATAYETLSDPEKRRAYDEGADTKKRRGRDDDSSDSEREERSLREEIERKYYPERYHFWPFGDPFIEKRKIQARKRRQAGMPAWYDDD